MQSARGQGRGQAWSLPAENVQRTIINVTYEVVTDLTISRML